MKLIISNGLDVPIYEQIKQQIKAAILSGDLQEGQACPSLRTVAKELRISVLTIKSISVCKIPRLDELSVLG